MFILDTNTLVYAFRGEGDVARRLLATPVSSIAIPTVVVYEVETGLAKMKDHRKRRTQFNALLSVVTVLPFGMEEAKVAAQIRAKLESRGGKIGPIDTLIAGTVLAQRGVLVTRNISEFQRVEGLFLENWYAEVTGG